MRISIFCLMFLHYASECYAEDDWLGSDNYGGFVGLRYGEYDDNAKSYSINSSLPVFWYSQLHLIYSEHESEFEDQNQDSNQWSIYWNSDPLQTISIGMGFDQNGRGSEVEHQDTHVYLHYTTEGDWSFRAKAMHGNIDLKLSEFSDEIEQVFRSSGLLSRRRSGIGMSANYDDLHWGIRLAANYYNYEDEPNFSIEGSRMFSRLLTEESLQEAGLLLRALYARVFSAYRRLGLSEEQSRVRTNADFDNRENAIREWANDWIERRSIARRNESLVYYRAIYNQQSLLSNRDIALDAYFTAGKATISSGILTYNSYIEEENASQIYAGVDYQLTDNYSIGALINYSSDGSHYYGELSMGIDW